MSEFHNGSIETSDMRFLWVLVKTQYPSVAAFARDIGVPRAYFHECITRNRIAVKYAGFLGRKFNFHPGLLKYETYMHMVSDPLEYAALIESAKFLVPADRRYILDGLRVSNVKKHLKTLDQGLC